MRKGFTMKSRIVPALAVASVIAFGALQDASAQRSMGGGMGQGSMGGMDHGSMGQGSTGRGSMSQGGTMSQAAEAMADGEVRKVDKDAGRLTIRHGAIPSMDMKQPMTMVYRVKEPAMLDQVKAGDKIRFSAEKAGGAFTVTRIEPAK